MIWRTLFSSLGKATLGERIRSHWEWCCKGEKSFFCCLSISNNDKSILWACIGKWVCNFREWKTRMCSSQCSRKFIERNVAILESILCVQVKIKYAPNLIRWPKLTFGCKKVFSQYTNKNLIRLFSIADILVENSEFAANCQTQQY